MTFLFWNCKNLPLQDYVAALAEEHDADLVVLAEFRFQRAALRSLNRTGPGWAYAASRVTSKASLFIRGARRFAVPLFDETPRMSIQQITFPTKRPLLLAMVHLASKRYYTAQDQATEAFDLSDAILQVEERAGHTRTVVLGDFNMAPFEEGLISAGGFNAVMSTDIASGERRTVARTSRTFFYNPMWKLLGGSSESPPGTFFKHPAGYASLYWHMLDQVLIRPRLLPHFNDNGVQILTKCSLGSLARPNGRPSVSDHFPIKLDLNY